MLQDINSERRTLILFSLFTLILRLITLMEINVGGDNLDYWYYSKALINNYDFGHLFHRNTRWGIIIPVSLFQLIFGTGVWVIYLIPLVMSLVLNIVIYKVGKYLFSSKIAFISIIFFQFFPYSIRNGSQLFLAFFSITYLFLSFYLLLRFMDMDIGSRKSTLYLIASALLLFAAYETKISNLYFLVPWIVIMFRKGLRKEILFYGILLLILYSLEHLSYALFTDFKLGRLELIAKGHFGSTSMTLGKSVQFDGTFLGLFERFSFKNFPIYWHIICWPGIIAGFILIKKNINRESAVNLITIILIFMLIQTFAVKSVNPFIPLEDFIVRYFSPLLPLFAMLISQLLLYYFSRIDRLLDSTLILRLLFLLPLIAVFGMASLLDKLPGAASKYLNNPFKPGKHHFIEAIEFEREIKQAYLDGYNFCTIDTSDDKKNRRINKKNLTTVNKLYLDNGVGLYNYKTIALDSDRDFIQLDIPENRDSNKLIFVKREPFELIKGTVDEIK